MTEVMEVARPRVAPVLGLLVPADPTAPACVILVRASSAAFSDAIGGGLLDDTVSGMCEGGRYGAYLDAERDEKELPRNDRAAVLLERLRQAGWACPTGLRGDALVVGIDLRGGDCDVPSGVLVAACEAGQLLVVEGAPGR